MHVEELMDRQRGKIGPSRRTCCCGPFSLPTGFLARLSLTLVVFSILTIGSFAERFDVTNVALNAGLKGNVDTPPIIFVDPATERLWTLYRHSSGQNITAHLTDPIKLTSNSYNIDMSEDPLTSLDACRFTPSGFAIVGSTQSDDTMFIEIYDNNAAPSSSYERILIGQGLEDPGIAFLQSFTGTNRYLVVTFVNKTSHMAQYVIYNAIEAYWGELLHAGDVSSLVQSGRIFKQGMPRVRSYRNDPIKFVIAWAEWNTTLAGDPLSWQHELKVRNFGISASDNQLTSSPDHPLFNPGTDEYYNFDNPRHLRLFEVSGGTRVIAAWARVYAGNGGFGISGSGYESVMVSFESVISEFPLDFVFRYFEEDEATHWPAAAGTSVLGQTWILFSHFTETTGLRQMWSLAGNGTIFGDVIAINSAIYGVKMASLFPVARPSSYYGASTAAFDTFLVSLTSSNDPSSNPDATNPVFASAIKYPAARTTQDPRRTPSYPSTTSLNTTFNHRSQLTESFTSPPNDDYNGYKTSVTTLFTGNVVFTIEYEDTVLVIEQNLYGDILAKYPLPSGSKRASVVALYSRYLVVWDQSNSTNSNQREVRGQYFQHYPPAQLSSDFIISAPGTNASYATVAVMNGTNEADGCLVAYVEITESRNILARYLQDPFYSYSTLPNWMAPEISVNRFGISERIVSFPRAERVANNPSGRVLVAWSSRKTSSGSTPSDTEIVGQYVHYWSGLWNTFPVQLAGPEFFISLPSHQLRSGDAIPLTGQWMYRSNLQLVSYRGGPQIAFVYQEEKRYSARAPSRIILGLIYSWSDVRDSILDSYTYDARSPSLTSFDCWRGKSAVLVWERTASSYQGLYYNVNYLQYEEHSDPVLIGGSKRSQDFEESMGRGRDVPSKFARPAITPLIYDHAYMTERRFSLFYYNGDAGTSKVNYQTVNFQSRYVGVTPTYTPPYKSPYYTPTSTPTFFTPARIRLLRSLPGIIIGCVFGILAIIAVVVLFANGCFKCPKCCRGGKSKSTAPAATYTTYTTSAATTSTSANDAATAAALYSYASPSNPGPGYGDEAAATTYEVEMVPVPPPAPYNSGYDGTGQGSLYRNPAAYDDPGDLEQGAGQVPVYNTLYRPY